MLYACFGVAQTFVVHHTLTHTHTHRAQQRRRSPRQCTRSAASARSPRRCHVGQSRALHLLNIRLQGQAHIRALPMWGHGPVMTGGQRPSTKKLLRGRRHTEWACSPPPRRRRSPRTSGALLPCSRLRVCAVALCTPNRCLHAELCRRPRRATSYAPFAGQADAWFPPRRTRLAEPSHSEYESKNRSLWDRGHRRCAVCASVRMLVRVFCMRLNLV
jgi:hypothetical protein